MKKNLKWLSVHNQTPFHNLRSVYFEIKLMGSKSTLKKDTNEKRKLNI
jgi:hypothetical protein